MLSYLFLPHSTINGSPKCYCKQIINIFWHKQANKANNSEFLKISNPTKSHYPSWNRWKMLMEKSQCRSFFSQMLNFFCFTYCMSFIHVTNKFLPVRPIYMSVITGRLRRYSAGHMYKWKYSRVDCKGLCLG